ncbi:molecular chaperone [Pseudoalteromonas sp. SWYJ118]|uniref:fimbrial biogenesis chaperone n=1 Tax=Pseudoalteromonas sp. SWYJ118 TaxID=2792062 RepID=UPI0018CCCA64|nr:fimbria/pilus periplasmic chaperone [Pseudoalteromonas sp. SWYJ118]MBH0074462.1 molecular chaperone [Pseudoalteromonas sp. SWYJ118]
MRYLFLIIFLLTSYSSQAFQVKPMVAELESSGSQSQQTIRISNPSDSPLTIEISAFDLSINTQGDEVLKANEEDFLIIPMTTIIPPGESQSVIVRYIGEPMLESSKAYRIAIDQVSVDLEKTGQSGIGMSVSFRTLFNVIPKGAVAKLVVKDKRQADTGIWSVLLENTGNKYIRLSQAQWLIKGDDQELLLEGAELSKALTGKILLPKSSREVSIKIPTKFNAASSDLEVNF